MKFAFGKMAFFSLTAALALTGCKKDGDTINVTTPITGNNTSRVTYVITLADADADGTAATNLGGSALSYFDGATQVMKNATSNGNGVFILKNVQPGAFSGQLSKPGYASLDFTADLTKNGGNDSTYVAASRVLMFRSSAQLIGLVYGNVTYSNVAPNATRDADIPESEVKVSYVLAKTGANAYPMGAGPGRLTDVGLSQSVITTSQSAGAGSSSGFAFSGLPVTDNPYLTATFSFVPKRFSVTTPVVRDSVFTLPYKVAGERNKIKVNLYPEEETRLGNLLIQSDPNP